MMNGSVSATPDRTEDSGRKSGPLRGGEQDTRQGRTYPRRAAQPTAAPHRRPLATLLNVNGFGWAARGERER